MTIRSGLNSCILKELLVYCFAIVFGPMFVEWMFRLALPADKNRRELPWAQQVRNRGSAESGKEIPKTYSLYSNHMVTDTYLHSHLNKANFLKFI